MCKLTGQLIIVKSDSLSCNLFNSSTSDRCSVGLFQDHAENSKFGSLLLKTFSVRTIKILQFPKKTGVLVSSVAEIQISSIVM